MAKKSTIKKATAKSKVKAKVKKTKPVVKKKTSPKKVVPKKPDKLKPVKKPALKKVIQKKKAVKPKAAPKKPLAKKTTTKPKAIVKKKVVKAKIKAKPVKKVIKAVSKKVTPKPKQKIIRKPVKKVIPVSKKKVIAKVEIKKAPIVKKELTKPAEIIKKPVQQIIEKPLTARIIQRPKIVALKNAMKFEANYNRADMFYKNVLKAEIIRRFTCSKEEDREYIKRDQNLLIKMNDKESSISEKSRDQDWNDIYVEIFRKYPDEEGWIRSTEADYIAYFFPGRVFWAKMEPLKILCYDILAKAIDSGIYKELFYMYPKNSGRLSKTFKINTKTYSFNFIQTYHEHGEDSHYSIGISLPFVLLMDFRIDYKIFKQ